MLHEHFDATAAQHILAQVYLLRPFSEQDAADRIAVMEQGKIVEVQEAEQLFETPESEITKTLLSAIPQIR